MNSASDCGCFRDGPSDFKSAKSFESTRPEMKLFGFVKVILPTFLRRAMTQYGCGGCVGASRGTQNEAVTSGHSMPIKPGMTREGRGGLLQQPAAEAPERPPWLAELYKNYGAAYAAAIASESRPHLHAVFAFVLGAVFLGASVTSADRSRCHLLAALSQIKFPNREFYSIIKPCSSRRFLQF